MFNFYRDIANYRFFRIYYRASWIVFYYFTVSSDWVYNVADAISFTNTRFNEGYVQDKQPRNVDRFE